MKEIGSEFALETEFVKDQETEWSSYFPQGLERIYLSTGRDSLVYAVRAHKIKKILLPAYIEDQVIEQLKKEKTEITFYRVDNALTADIEDIKRRAESSDALLIVHYFGFPQPLNALVPLCKQKKLLLIEDCVQAMLSSYLGRPVGSFGNVSFNSLRKFMGIPDGSILCCADKTKIVESHLHQLYLDKRMKALAGKYHYLAGRGSRYYFKQAFKTPESLLSRYPKPAPMSIASLLMLKHYDFSGVIKRRRANFRILLSALRRIALFKKLPAGVCPLGFPILVNDREKVKEKLIASRIYPPVHWHLPSIIHKRDFQESWKISNSILTIPLDQRYSSQDMKRIIKILRGAI